VRREPVQETFAVASLDCCNILLRPEIDAAPCVCMTVS
jgi:hypothetical protein